MAYYIPVYRKMNLHRESLVRRELPIEGDLIVKVGDSVLPFTKIGRATISKDFLVLPPKIKIQRSMLPKPLIYEGEVLGRAGFRSFKAPFNGYFEEDSINGLVYKREKQDYWMLAGVWGVVSEVVGGRSVTIKAQVIDINFSAACGTDHMAELIVFPNPSKLLDLEYLQNFSKGIKGKIVYVGDFLRKELVLKAIELKVGALIGGSIEKDIFNLAKSRGLGVGITTGFGQLQTPSKVFDFLKTVSNRHVFIDVSDGKLTIPIPSEFNTSSFAENGESICEVKKEVPVLVLQSPYFGREGKVDDIQNDKIYVKLNESEEVHEINNSNLLALL
ncbi:hypothetical protein H6802_01865 [Candidatus Nomurabacteria bacterium]|uniref:Uncharacterized protein n=1 Tax=candidate division WWE3 bacterium TaxID=2053526 RepID=A0A955IWX5_UNCKA|nr:hypothetical protein [candidate division WWE3 bacterium]MCB9823678.1 hypothetical protein [Candidatus Nomurabacteria bacterium]MCB9827244.1 hypothetical protein [Candidatus Nomurabacteria bacterium]MCB9827473.1 hypothetical protein [Candidatus Nomurabacteria bacterium]HXK52595.1 hypothetical protein [bacterium]